MHCIRDSIGVHPKEGHRGWGGGFRCVLMMETGVLDTEGEVVLHSDQYSHQHPVNAATQVSR